MSKPKAYYNEIEPFAVEWLRNLIAAGLIAAGVVDDRSIVDVSPDDLKEFTQCHFFAGIGVWSHALRRAGWPDDRQVWTGSCPCQPFSLAGGQGGTSDERHLWPIWFKLIEARRPPVVFGEQVASAAVIGGSKKTTDRPWLDVVFDDLEGAHYSCGAADIPAAGFGAPHIRQRLWFVAHTDDILSEWGQRGLSDQEGWQESGLRQAGLHGAVSLLDNSSLTGSRRNPRAIPSTQGEGESQGGTVGCQPDQPVSPGPTNGFWRDAEWVPCRDGKARPVEPGTFPLAHGAPSRVGRLRAYGNAICAPVAEAFIRAAHGAIQ
jgi:DNA (cytosine-5)-methyltransferase 1